MPDRERIIRGLDFEGRVRDALGGRLMPGSGNQWHAQGDVRGRLVVSCKAEAIKSWNRVREQLREAIDMAFGTGALPVLALLDDDGEELAVMRMADLAKALAGDGIAGTIRTRGDIVRENMDLPAILRDG